MTVPRPFGLLRFLPLQPRRAIGVLAAALGLVWCALLANSLQQVHEQVLADWSMAVPGTCSPIRACRAH